MIGVWATAKRQKSRMYDDKQGRYGGTGPWEQVSRLGNPLVNEVLDPDGGEGPVEPHGAEERRQVRQVRRQARAGALLPVLYPGAFPNLAKYGKPRADLNAILLTGIPKGVVPGFQNFTGRCRPTCSGSTWRSRRRRRRTTSAWSRATPPGSPTVAGSTTTSSPSSCGPSPA